MPDGTLPNKRPAEAKLTDAYARALPLVPKGARPPQYAVRDATVKGFRVVVGTTTRTWAARVEVWESGKRREHANTFGHVGSTTCADARKAAAAWLGKVRNREERPVPKHGGTTVRQGIERFTEHLREMVEDGERSEGTIEYYREVCFGPPMRDWLDRPIASITPAMVEERYKELRRPTGDGYTYFRSNDMVKALRRLYRFLKVEKRDPTMPPEAPTSTRRLRREEESQVGLGPSDIARWGDDLLKISSTVRRCFVLMTLLTGSRPGALSLSKWEHIRRQPDGCWTLFVPKPKGGSKKAYHIPLTREMMWVLLVCRTAGRIAHWKASQTWVFPEANASGHIQDWRVNGTLYGKALRKTYRTLCTHLGIDPTVSMILMNHSASGNGASDVHNSYVLRGKLGEAVREAQGQVSAFVMQELTSHRH